MLIYKQLAGEEANKFRFAYSTTKEVLEEKKCDGFSLYVYLPGKFVNEKYDRPKQRYPSKTITGSQQLKNFVFSKSLPLVGELTFANKPIYVREMLHPLFLPPSLPPTHPLTHSRTWLNMYMCRTRTTSLT